MGICLRSLPHLTANVILPVFFLSTLIFSSTEEYDPLDPNGNIEMRVERKKEVIWSMVGAKTTQQGDCSKYTENVPRSCKKDITVVDLLPGTPYNEQIVNCCKGGLLSSLLQDPSNAASSFQLNVGEAGT